MKTRNLLAAACMTALAMAATGCSNDLPVDNATPDNPQPEMGITEITAAMPAEGPSTRLKYDADNAAALSVKWEDSYYTQDKFFAFNVANGAWKGSKFIRSDNGGASQSATFTSYDLDDNTKKAPLQNGGLIALYPVKNEYQSRFYQTTGETQEITLPFADQDGTLESVDEFHYMTALTTIGGSSAPTLAFDHRIAILQIDGFTFPADVPTNTSFTDITISGTGLRGGKLVITKDADNSVTSTIQLNDADSPINVTSSVILYSNTSTSKRYFCFLPNQNGISNLKVTGTVEGTKYEYAYTGTVGTSSDPFLAGQMYTLSNITMTEVPPRTGDYYYSDGSYSATLDRSKNWIGVVVVGDLGTLVVGTMHGEKYMWSLTGVETSATDANNGLTNMNTIRGHYDLMQYPAFEICYNQSNAPSEKTWYLPSINELKLIMNNKDVLSQKLYEAGFGELNSTLWSSTEVDQTQAKAIDANGTEITQAKSSQSKVRGVLKIN